LAPALGRAPAASGVFRLGYRNPAPHALPVRQVREALSPPLGRVLLPTAPLVVRMAGPAPPLSCELDHLRVGVPVLADPQTPVLPAGPPPILKGGDRLQMHRVVAATDEALVVIVVALRDRPVPNNPRDAIARRAVPLTVLVPADLRIPVRPAAQSAEDAPTRSRVERVQEPLSHSLRNVHPAPPFQSGQPP